jgi:hypothetical protein
MLREIAEISRRSAVSPVILREISLTNTKR